MKTEHLRASSSRSRRAIDHHSQAFGESMTGVPGQRRSLPQRSRRLLLPGHVASWSSSTNTGQARQHDRALDAGSAEANKVTLKMLANQNLGYPDYEDRPTWLAAFTQIVSHLDIRRANEVASARPYNSLGRNWTYSHTNFMILGEILSRIGTNRWTYSCAKGLGPMGLKNTTASQTFRDPEPVLHAFDSERRAASKIPSDIAFYGNQHSEPAMGDADRSEQTQLWMPWHDRGQGRHRCTVVEV